MTPADKRWFFVGLVLLALYSAALDYAFDQRWIEPGHVHE